MRIDPKLMIEFVAIAEELSFTRAALKLRVAQPWLSARLHKLEDLLGFSLLVRTTRSVVLTERGIDFLAVARQVAIASEAANQRAVQLRRLDKAILRIGAAPYTKFLPIRRELMDRFVDIFPDVSVELETGWTLALLGRLDAHEIDLTFLMGEVDELKYEGVQLGEFRVGLFVPTGHPLSIHSVVPADAVAKGQVQVFTRSLNPRLWDALYAPLVSVGAVFVEVPELAEGVPMHLSPNSVAAFFDFGERVPNSSDVVRIEVDVSKNIGFHLIKLIADKSDSSSRFMTLASSLAFNGDHLLP